MTIFHVFTHRLTQIHLVVLVLFIGLISACTPLSDKSTHDTQANHVETADVQTPVNILFVRAEEKEDDTWTFSVTIEHEDTGWEDYADGWDVMLEDGMVLKTNPDSQFTRLLTHPHLDEQPFTRSQSNILIPAGTNIIRVRAHELAEGYSGNEVVIDFSITEGKNYQIVKNVE